MIEYETHHRRSIRLGEYDYSQASAYSLTICTYRKQCILSSIENGVMRLNRYGRIVDGEWLRTNQVRTQVELDEYIIMPNHLHAILVITDDRQSPSKGFGSTSQTIGAIVRGFKASVTRQFIDVGWPKDNPVWQRGYWDHVIRNEQDLNDIRHYIRDNPHRWNQDRENPACAGAN